jgi:hypothetical protein
MQGSDGRSLITPTGRALTRCLWSVTCQSPPRTRKAPHDPHVAARKLVEIAKGVEAVQDGRIYIERAIALGWLWLHESGI